MSNPLYNVFVAGQSSSVQGEQLLVDEQPQRDLSTGLPHLHSEPSLCFSGTTSLKSVGLATSVTHGSENNAARLEGTRTASIISCTSDGFYSSSAEFLATSDGKRHSDVDCDKSLSNLSSNPTSDASSKSIADLNVGGTNIVDHSDLPDLNDLAITRQAAAKILMNYGLEKEDLDELILCPAEQTTAQNLPRTLWKIRMKKAMRAATENKSPLYSEAPFPSRDYGLDTLSAPEGDGTGQAPVPPNTGQSREVIDSGHLEKCTAVVDKNMDITDSAVKSGDVLHNEKFSKQPPQEGRTLVKSSVLNLLVTNVGLKRNSETPLGSGSVKLLQNEPNSSLTKSKSEVSKSSLLEKLDPTVEPGYGSFTEIIPKPDWISMKGNAISFANGQMEIQDEVPKFTVKSMEQPPQHLLQSHIVQTVVSQVVPAYKPVSFPYFNFPARNDSPFPQSVTRPCSSVHLSPQQVLDPAKTNEKPPLEKSTAKSPPSVTMMHDFAGFTPSKFPHTCSLCKKTCSQMKEWISHKNTSLHLKNCKDLREHSSSLQDDWTFTSRNHSCSKSLERDCSPRRSEKSRLSPKRSIERHPSPRRSIERRPSPRRSIERRSSPRRSIERRPSPRRSRERRPSPMRSRDRCLSPMRSRERRPSPRRSREQRPSPSRSRERRLSPRRSRERRLSPRRSRERRLSPRRSRERRFSPRRSRERRSSPRRSRERRLSPKRSRERRPSPRRSRERRPLPRRIIVRRSSSRSSSERESLPRRGIERRSSSRSSIERWFSPKRSRERRSSSRSSREQESLPRRSRERRSSSRINKEKRLSPRLSHERSTSPKRIEEGYLLKSSRSSQQKKDGKQSSLTKICKRKASLPEPSSSQKKPCSLENLTERLLKAPVVQSLSGQPNVEDMVKTVIPVVLEELARMSSSSSLSSPTSLSKLIEDSSPSSGESMFSLAGSTSSPSSAVKVEKSTNMGSSPLQNKNSSSVKSKHSKPSPPTMVKLKGTFDTLCHSDLISAMDIFGKTKSVLLFKSKQEARVCFEKEEAALKLKASQNFEIKGVTVTVVPEKVFVSFHFS
uniref:C2H2-type domain-containing protein n=1 Tax=Oryzias latipes TaxID=8090 RepID=A0A3P9I6C8_ORYLA